MKRLAKPLLWLGGVVVIGTMLVLLIPRATEPALAPAAETAEPAALVQTEPTDGAISAPAMSADTPPWMAQGASAPRATAAASANLRATPTLSSTGEINRALAQVREQAARNERNADELLSQIDAMKASGQVPDGVNLDVLRSNLLVAKRAQMLARELAELTQQADTPARKKRIGDITGELQELQSQLRYDVGMPMAAQAAPAVSGRKQ